MTYQYNGARMNVRIEVIIMSHCQGSSIVGGIYEQPYEIRLRTMTETPLIETGILLNYAHTNMY